MNDTYYTPDWLAKLLVSQISESGCASVYDPTAGTGELLTAFQRRFGTCAQVFGTDIDVTTVKQMQNDHSEWFTGYLNIFNPRSTRSSRVWNTIKTEGIDVLLCNPPFSYKGQRGKPLRLFGKTMMVSPAAHVAANTLFSLQPRIGLYGVFPESTLSSTIDSEIWRLIRENYDVEVLYRPTDSTFAGTRARTCLLKIAPKVLSSATQGRAVPLEPQENIPSLLVVRRGHIQMHKAKILYATGGVPFIHTTNLDSEKVKDFNRILHTTTHDRGFYLLFPRVGNIHPGKISSFETESEFILSDCVMSVKCDSEFQMKEVQNFLKNNFNEFSSLYSGTGAKYVTLARMNNYFAKVERTILGCPVKSPTPALALSA